MFCVNSNSTFASDSLFDDNFISVNIAHMRTSLFVVLVHNALYVHVCHLLTLHACIVYLISQSYDCLDSSYAKQ